MNVTVDMWYFGEKAGGIIMNTVEPIRDMDVIWDIADYFKQWDERNYVMFLCGIYMGLRISDILKLKVRDVRKAQYVIIREQKTGKEKKFPINKELRPVLNRYIEGMKDYEYLFQSRQGKNHPISRQQAYNIMSAAKKQFGLDSIGTHTLRKTFGYHMYKQTGDIATLKEILNHADISVTFRYIGINQETKDDRIQHLSYKR